MPKRVSKQVYNYGVGYEGVRGDGGHSSLWFMQRFQKGKGVLCNYQNIIHITIQKFLMQRFSLFANIPVSLLHDNRSGRAAEEGVVV